MTDYRFVCRRHNREDSKAYECQFATDAEAIAAAKGMWVLCEPTGRVVVMANGRGSLATFWNEPAHG